MFEIGHSLRSARERQGLGYPEIELATKIRAKYIRALEEEDFDSLPGDAYVRGFLRSYADYLGLDGEIYVDEYASRFHLTDYWSDEPAPRSRPRRTRRERTIERRAVLLALVGIAILTALVFAAWQYGGATTNVPALDRKQTNRSELVVRGIGSGTYVVIRRDGVAGALAFQGTLSAGDVERVLGTHFYLALRKPAGAKVTLGGRAVSLPAVHNLRVLVTPQRTTQLG
ncbi:MAG TPA: helix-turn-helix domain-containing protein [Gaiellaceae bacterium]|nr:helix-turn-helix domain-containing protein [Gaiellaceae bacterium]